MASSRGPRAAVGNRRLVLAIAGVLGLVAVPMGLAALKFGHPLDTGYPRMYEGRTDRISLRARECFYGVRYVPLHARAMNWAFPGWDIRSGTLYPVTTGTDGAGIWFTCPILLAVFGTAGRWWRDRARRALMLSSLLVVAGMWGYHTTGSQDSGYYRYALDFIPVWLLVIAPFITGRRGGPLTLACVAFSALYFNLLPAL